jgi:MFS family permease
MNRLLRANPAFRALWFARTVSYAGDSVGLVALMLYVAESAGQAIAVSLLLLVVDFVPSLLGPFTGAVSDRFDRRRVMIACELVQGLLVLLVALTLPALPLLLALVGVRAIAGQVFQPASRAMVPALVADRDLPAANSAIGFGTNGGEAIGPLIAAALFPLIGIRGVLLFDAATFLFAAGLLLKVRPAAAEQAAAPARESLFHDARTGLRYIASHRVVRIVVLGFAGVVACNGIDDVALVLLAKETFTASDSAVGVLLAAVGLGLLAGYALLARYGGAAPAVVLLLAGFAVSSFGNLLTGLAWAVAAAFALQAVRGVGIAAMDIGANTMLQRLVAPGLQGRVFGNLYGLVGVAAAASYIGGGVLLDATSAPVTLLIAGAGGTLVTLAAAVALRPRNTQHTDP